MDSNETPEMLVEQFQDQYARLVRDCAEAEASGRWNAERDGSAEGFAFSALSGAILSLIISDGNVGEHETDYLNRIFGFDYSVDDLLGLFRFSTGDLRKNAVPNVREAVRILREADPAAAADFQNLLRLACRIISESDDGVLDVESDLIRQLEEAAE